VKVGSAVGVAVVVGLAGADDGGVDDGGAVADGVAVVDGEIDGLADAEGLAVALGSAEVFVGAGAGGPKQPERANRAQTPRTLTADSLGLVMMPPCARVPHFRDSAFNVHRWRRPEHGLKSAGDRTSAVAAPLDLTLKEQFLTQ
jgi:hypothetical protein